MLLYFACSKGCVGSEIDGVVCPEVDNNGFQKKKKFDGVLVFLDNASGITINHEIKI